MKKLFVAATLGLALVSCGGPSVCDCVKLTKDVASEMMSAKDDAGRKAVEEKYDGQMKDCDAAMKDMSPEEGLKAMSECK
jgi:hypothetical protein